LAKGYLQMDVLLQLEDLGEKNPPEKNLGSAGIGRQIAKSRSQICS
jgi:hypothetical protein